MSTGELPFFSLCLQQHLSGMSEIICWLCGLCPPTLHSFWTAKACGEHQTVIFKSSPRKGKMLHSVPAQDKTPLFERPQPVLGIWQQD